MEMTTEQQRALAVARARVRVQSGEETPAEEVETPQPVQGPGKPSIGFTDFIGFGFADEAKGAGSAVGEFLYQSGKDVAGGSMPDFRRAASEAGKAYNETAGAHREAMKQFREENPGLSIAGDIGGGLVSGRPEAVAGAWARMPAWLRASGLGGLFGGAYGVGEGEGLEDTAIKGGVGAAGGALTGAAVHGALSGVRGAYNKVADVARSYTRPEKAAAIQTARAFASDEVTPGRALARLKELGPQATIADVGGENVMGLARGAAGTPGAAKNRIISTLENRAAGEAERLGRVVKQTLSPKDYFASESQILTKLKDNATSLYSKAYETHQDIMTPKLSALLKRPVMQKALREASSLAGIDNSKLGVVSKELTEAAKFAAEVGKMEPVGKVSRGFKLETWDNIKRGVDSLIDRETNPMTGALNNRGRLLVGLKKELVSALDGATGGEKSLYKAARTAYAGDAEVLKAIRDGRNFMKLDPARITEKMAGMSEAAKEAYRSGAARAVMDTVESTVDQASAANRLFNKSITRQKIAKVFPDQKKFNEFRRVAEAERRFAKTKNYIGSGSRTAPMAEEIAGVQDKLGNLGAVIGSNLPVSNSLVAAGIGRKMAQRILPQTDRSAALARVLANRNQAMNQLFLEQMMRQGNVPGVGPVNPLLGGIGGGVVSGQFNR